MEDSKQYFDIERCTEVREKAKKLRRQYLRYKEAELVYSIQNNHCQSIWYIFSTNSFIPGFFFGVKNIHDPDAKTCSKVQKYGHEYRCHVIKQ